MFATDKLYFFKISNMSLWFDLPSCVRWCTLVVCIHCEGLFIRCDELLDFLHPRLKVQHIPGCTGQYYFNRHAALRHSSLEFCPTLLQKLQSLLAEMQQGSQGWHTFFFLGVSYAPTIKNIWAPRLLSYLSGASLMADTAYITAEKTKRKRVRVTPALGNHSVDAAKANQCVCHSGKLTSQDPVKAWKTHRNCFEKYEEETSRGTAEVGCS